MAIHEVSVTGGNAMDSLAVCTCEWISLWSITGAAADTHDAVIDFAERTHLSHPAWSGQMVVIAGARLTRRDHSFVGQMENGDRVIIQEVVGVTTRTRWKAFEGQTDVAVDVPITASLERVSEVVRNVEWATGRTFR